MTHSLIPVSLHEDTLYLVEHGGEPYTPARPICDALGLPWQAQTEKLKEPRWKSTAIRTVAQDGKKREMLCLPLRKLPGWLMSISPAKVKPDVREKLERYQDECDDVLWRYWTGQVVKKPNPEEPKALPYATKEQREPLVKAIRRAVKVAESRGRKLGYDEAHAIVNLRLGVTDVEHMTVEQVQRGVAIAGELLERVVLEGEYIAAGESAQAPEPAWLSPAQRRALRERMEHATASAREVTGLDQQVANRLRVRFRLERIDDLS